MDAEVRRIIGEAYNQTQKLLSDNKDKLDKVRMAFMYIKPYYERYATLFI